MSVLTEIVSRKRERLEVSKDHVPLSRIRELAHEYRSQAAKHRLGNALQGDGINIIAEFKRRSPSKGLIRGDVDAGSIAKNYQDGGAIAVSVLTEQDYFSGSLNDLREVKSAVALPVLRKDFLFDEYQIYESAACGADAILLIVASLDDEQLKRLRELADNELGMDVLVEVHNELELARALAAGASLIGVNNRNLHTFEVSLETSLNLVLKAPSDAILVSESGLQSARDLALLRDAGYRGFLIGESLMRAESPVTALRDMRRPEPNSSK
jgi:indole-3-glycerol phosphate synthase